MEKEAISIVEGFLNAVQTVNMEQLGAILHPDMTWSQPGSNRVSGKKNSAGEVFQMVGQMFALSANTLSLTDIRVLAANGNQVACLLHWKATQPSGKQLDVDNIDVYTVEQGRIVAATVFTTDIDQENGFWAE